MKKSELIAAVQKNMGETHDALQTVYDSLNPGQKKQIVKVEAVKVLLVRYGVVTEAAK